MKTNNKYIIRYFKIFNIIILLLIISNILMYVDLTLHRYHSEPKFFITGLIILLIFISSRIGNQFYSIDTKGETITFETKNIGFFSFINSKTNKIDLPKYKLINYEYHKGLISKELVFYINSKNKVNLSKTRFRLAFISTKDMNNILFELEQIVETNRLVKNNLEVSI
ncbi:hypothetical protein [Chishuiella changwenlii]|uniref:hypothetical protein n=1 Tax=Chishuiella changwenlii TaxID=1434701 RepID=UPI002FD98757